MSRPKFFTFAILWREQSDENTLMDMQDDQLNAIFAIRVLKRPSKMSHSPVAHTSSYSSPMTPRAWEKTRLFIPNANVVAGRYDNLALVPRCWLGHNSKL